MNISSCIQLTSHWEYSRLSREGKIIIVIYGHFNPIEPLKATSIRVHIA